jgi:hypothetical protein
MICVFAYKGGGGRTTVRCVYLIIKSTMDNNDFCARLC